MNWWKGTTDTNSYLEECETPTREQEYKELADNTFNMLLELEKGSDEWTLLSSNDNIQTFEKPDPSGFSCLKTQGILPCSPKFLYDKIWFDDLKKRQQWEPEMKDLRIIENITKDIQVTYRAYSAPYPVAGRDFVVMNSRRPLKNNEGFAVFGTSINHSFTNPEGRCVRGNAIVSGFIFRPINESPHKCLGVRIVQMDPKGMVPPWVSSLTKKKATHVFEALRKVVAETYVPDVISEGKQETEESPTEPSSPTQHHPVHSQIEEEEEEEEYEEALESQTTEDLQHPERIVTEQKKFAKPKVTREPPSVSRSELQSTLKAIRSLLENLQIEVRTNHQRLEKMETSLVQKQSSPPVKPPRISLQSLSWDLLFLIFVWPFLAFKLYHYLQQRFQKRLN